MLAISQVDLNARLLTDVTYMHAKIMEIRRIYLKVRCRRGLLMNALISQWRMANGLQTTSSYGVQTMHTALLF